MSLIPGSISRTYQNGRARTGATHIASRAEPAWHSWHVENSGRPVTTNPIWPSNYYGVPLGPTNFHAFRHDPNVRYYQAPQITGWVPPPPRYDAVPPSPQNVRSNQRRENGGRPSAVERLPSVPEVNANQRSQTSTRGAAQATTPAPIRPPPEYSSAELLRDAATRLDEYIYNAMPAHLIYVPTKKIIGRGDVKAFVLTPLKEHLDKFLRNGPFESNYERECAIGTSIRNVAKYAIFSHRWLNEGEPSFQDMLQERTPTGPGYDKFTRFCKIANSYGCLFAWSDTCCINKESSTELEEAIRSMFRWYSNAHVCIAYLADSSSPEDFKNDVWFTRGWTLQELLAPKMVRFFGAGWQYLGDRDDIGNGGKFTALISAVTTIPVVDLQRFRPGRDRVHEKMRWAARRKTTRVEDIAYCLLGIFDVSLTVAYGEGKQAWARLMEAIIQSCDEWQVFAAAGNFWGVIPDSPSRYCALSSKSAPILGFENRHLQRRDSGDRFFEITKRGVQLKVFAVEVVWKERGCSHLCLHSQRLPPGSPCPAHAVYLPNTRQYPAGTFLPVDMGGSHLPWTISDIHRYGDFTEWALGILNYKETESSDEGELEGKKDYIFLLLGRVGQQGRVDSRSRTYHDNLWCKVPTAQVFTVHCKKTIRRPLTTVWL